MAGVSSWLARYPDIDLWNNGWAADGSRRAIAKNGAADGPVGNGCHICSLHEVP